MCPYWDPETEATVIIPGHPGAYCHRFVRLSPSSTPELSICFTSHFLTLVFLQGKPANVHLPP